MALGQSERHLILVAGARPNFMKVAPIIHELGRRPGLFQWSLVHTGQHYDEKMSGVFFSQLGLPEPNLFLGIGGGTHGQQTGRILEAFETYLLGLPSPPAGVVVVGDVNSTVACALAAVKLHIPVAHLEAGLRSMDRMMPEEINRLVTDAVSDVLLVSEPDGMTNLQKEGIQGDRVHYVGNIMIDSLVAHLEAASTTNAPAKYGLEKVPYALVTLHRPSNVDDPERLMALARSLERVATKLPIVFPAHPRTQQKLDELNVLRLEGNINIVEPLPYFEMLSLQKGATVVITDSGGIQEETSYLGIPCLTLRENTERPVTVALGTNTLIPGSPEQIQDHVDAILAGNYRLSQAIPGWDGKTAERVVNLLDKVW